MAQESILAEQARAARESSERQAEIIEKNKTANEKLVDARLAAKEKQNAEYYERKANEQPTPTQRENDLARMGALDIDNKEDDGSEWQDELDRRVMLGNVDNPYVTREMASEGEERPKKKKRSR